jgi:hypothetical protein
MTLKEWRKKQGISHYTLGTMLRNKIHKSSDQLAEILFGV